jgi:urate oxidase
MPSTLGANSYGKSAVRLVTVTRHGTRHELRDLTVSMRLDGTFEAAHLAGDNSGVLPTDTMKNTVYALAKAHAASPIEPFGTAIGQRLLASSSAATTATIEIVQHEWDRIRLAERPHEHAFVRGAPHRRVAWVSVTRGGSSFEAGILGLGVLKTTGSAFSGFLRDSYTTLRETRDRILATEVEASWRYAQAPDSFDLAWHTVHDALIETFADHDSESVQHTLYAMGTAAIDRCEDVAEICLTLPNRHHLLVDLSPFGQTNANEVFVATEAPYGLIEATVTRT